MKVKVINQTDSELEIVIEGEGNTLLSPLRDILLDDDKVTYASYVIEHPMKSLPHLVLKTVNKKAIEALTEASSKMVSLVEELSGKFLNLAEKGKQISREEK